MNRHRLAVRKTRSSIALGSEVGVAIAITPAYALMRTVQNIGRKASKTLAHAVEKLHLPAAHSRSTKITELLDFSSFGSLSEIPTDGSNSDLDLRAIHLIECGTDDDALVQSEVLLAKVLLATGESLLPSQHKQLSGQLTWWRSITAKAKRLARRLTMSYLPESISQSMYPFHDKSAAAGLASTESRKITGLASDIATKELVLILGNTTVWDGLSTAQKRQIRDKIDALLSVNSPLQQVTRVRRSLSASSLLLHAWQPPTSQSLVKTVSQAVSVVRDGLVRPVHSFWVAVLQMISGWFHQGEEVFGMKSLALCDWRLPNFSLALLGAANNFLDAQCLTSIHSIYKLASPTLPSHTLAAAHSTSDMQCAVPSHTTQAKSYLDATVISVDYVEHPLEKVLKWVDRFLVWIENWWQRLLDWRQQHRQGKKQESK